jgi:hypothetical protein
MKKFLSLFLLSVFVNFNLVITDAYAITVKKGTVVPFVMNETKTSSDVFAGEKIKGQVDRDVYVNGKLVFKKGSRAYFYVTDAQKKAFWGQGGKIVIDRGYISDVNGAEHRVDFSKQYQGQETTWSVVVATLGLATIVLFPLGLFGFVRGKDAKVVQNVELEAETLDAFNFVPNL